MSHLFFTKCLLREMKVHFIEQNEQIYVIAKLLISDSKNDSFLSPAAKFSGFLKARETFFTIYLF